MTDSGSGRKRAVGSDGSMQAVFSFAQKWVLPFVLAFVTWQHNTITDLDKRINTLEKEAVTQQALQLSEKKTFAYIDVRIGDLAKRQDITNDYLKILVEKRK